MRERLMTPKTASLEGGHLVMRDARGIVRWTSNPADAAINGGTRRGFDINRVRLSHLERLILTRYGGPVDTDDASAYLSVAMNAIALSRRFRGWKQSVVPLLKWAAEWTPLADPTEVMELAQKVATAPRKMKALTAGKLLRLSTAEWEALGIKTIDPSDVAPTRIAAIKAERKRERDRKAAEAARREGGRRAMDEIKQASMRAFCKRHSLSERSFYRHQAAGDLDSWLTKKGITEKWQTGVAVLEIDPNLISLHSSATFTDKPKSRLRQGAPKRPCHEDCSRGAKVSVTIQTAEPTRREQIAKLYDLAANIFAPPVSKAANLGGSRSGEHGGGTPHPAAFGGPARTKHALA